MIQITASGDFRNTERFLKKMSSLDISAALKNLGQRGVAALAAATPVDSGSTAAMWGFETTRSRKSFSITWTNSNVVSGRPIVILLQYGHGTGTGGYVRGRDFINPAIQPIFDEIAEEFWKVVVSA